MPSKLPGQELSESWSVYLRPISIPALWTRLVPKYRSQNYGAAAFRVEWNSEYAEKIEKISPRRAENRIDNYLDPVEMDRVYAKLQSKGEASARFGFLKTGHGYDGERGDFCLIGGVVKNKELSLYYRSLEMMGGFAFDLTLINWVETYWNCDFKTVTFFAMKVFVFALKGNSNERLYPQLKRILKD